MMAALEPYILKLEPEGACDWDQVAPDVLFFHGRGWLARDAFSSHIIGSAT